MTEYLPWWGTAIGLAVVTLLYSKLTSKPFGVSGSWARLTQWNQDKEIEQAEKPFVENPSLLIDALMAATIREFGQNAVERAMSQGVATGFDSRAHAIAAAEVKTVANTDKIPASAHFVFLFCLLLGGVLSSLILHGNVSFSYDLGQLHRSIFGNGISYAMALFFGGLMVGFGTQLSNGCTSGHGLSGVSRFVPASLIATASFFGAAVVISLLMKGTGA